MLLLQATTTRKRLKISAININQKSRKGTIRSRFCFMGCWVIDSCLLVGREKVEKEMPKLKKVEPPNFVASNKFAYLQNEDSSD